MKKRMYSDWAFLLAVALFLSGETAAFATMPAGARRTRKDKERALSQYVADMQGRIGRAGGEAGKAVGSGAAKAGRATGSGAARLYRAAGQGAEKFYKEMNRVCTEAGGGVAEFCTKSYQQVNKELRSKGRKNPKAQRGSSRYAPFDRSRDNTYSARQGVSRVSRGR